MVTTIPSTTTNKDDNGVYSWSKTVKDVNNVDETFANARDIGYLRMNVSRVNVIGSLSANYDTSDMYKVSVQSNGKLSIAIRSGDTSDQPVLDLSKYEAYIDSLKQQLDPVGYAKEQADKLAAQAEQSLMEQTAPGMRLQVYMTVGNRQVLVADSAADADSPLRIAADQMLTGDYQAKKGDYYVKVMRDDATSADTEIPYAIQMKVGTTYKNDYTVTEQVSDDTKNKKTSTIPTTTSSGSILSKANVLQIQASRYGSAANMLVDAYLNMVNINNKNVSLYNKFYGGKKY